jgi:pyruvate/2-oxoglutarate dehydrogenase complex dihydrolipoamide acyltransferase (E2) component
LTLATALRQEQDDEAAFASSIPDYEEFRDSIKKMKERLPPVARTASGLHKQMYLYLKSQKPEVQATLLGTTPLPTVPPSEPTPAPPAAPGPKAVPPPPSATPTPGARSTPPPAPETKSKLKSNPRVERLAAAMGMSIESYLLQCEGNGMTQEQLDSFGVTKAEAPGRRKSVYDLV